MITNDTQYQVTKSQLAELEKSLPAGAMKEDRLDGRLRDAVRASLRSQIEELRDQLAEYERLKGTSSG
jgi:hypothetical protein